MIRASMIVRIFYAVMLYEAVSLYSGWILLMEREGAEPLWPVAWTAFMPWRTAVIGVGLVFVLGAALAAMAPRSLWLRITAFAGVFQFQAMQYSFGKIDHNLHLIVGIALVFIFLPDPYTDPGASGASQARRQRRYLEVFWSAQAFVLLTYTLAGISKLHGGLIDILMDRRSFLSADALAAHIANDFVSRGKASSLGVGEFIIDHPEIGGPLFWGAILLEFFSFAVAWKPGLHRIWGLLLIGLHVGIGLAMEIWFRPVLLVLGMFLIASPFAPQERAVLIRLRDIPWLGSFLCALRAEMKSQRKKTSGKTEPGERITVFIQEDWKYREWLTELLSESKTANLFQIRPMSDDGFRERAEAFPYLATVDSVVVDSGEGASREIRTASEACLWTLAHLPRSAWRNAFILLLIPAALLDPVLAFVTRRSAPAKG
jgi:hypothetical protein